MHTNTSAMQERQRAATPSSAPDSAPDSAPSSWLPAATETAKQINTTFFFFSSYTHHHSSPPRDSLLSSVCSSAPCWPPSTAALKQGSRHTSERLLRASVTLLLPANSSSSSLHCSSASWQVSAITSFNESLHASLHLLRQPAPPSSQPTPPSTPTAPPWGRSTGKRRASRRDLPSPRTHNSSGLRRGEEERRGGEEERRRVLVERKSSCAPVTVETLSLSSPTCIQCTWTMTSSTSRSCPALCDDVIIWRPDSRQPDGTLRGPWRRGGQRSEVAVLHNRARRHGNVSLKDAVDDAAAGVYGVLTLKHTGASTAPPCSSSPSPPLAQQGNCSPLGAPSQTDPGSDLSTGTSTGPGTETAGGEVLDRQTDRQVPVGAELQSPGPDTDLLKKTGPETCRHRGLQSRPEYLRVDQSTSEYLKVDQSTSEYLKTHQSQVPVLHEGLLELLLCPPVDDVPQVDAVIGCVGNVARQRQDPDSREAVPGQTCTGLETTIETRDHNRDQRPH
ncbi:hypothetical protein EYF80_006281 [Liparis tanakae]|uniref:Uncharacterized protein n=1 Tax=Liparis tanakae TaxID=230148 RepID=A0A4Z2IZ94_9TELE|nr:hypothetical protein EYF80_006281 [Liparis tanakae]